MSNSSAPASPALPDSLTHGRIFKFYLPLALSWLFMAIEGPVCVSAISRLADPIRNTAAFNLLLSLALFIESPVIDLLSTSTTLASSRANFLTLQRFVIGLMLLQTAIHAGFVLSPLYELLTVQWMRIPEATAASAKMALIIMIPWSAFIGWRRYHQGILIRYGQTRWVGLGTFVRMITLATIATTLYLLNVATGTTLAGIALISSVFAEAAFAHFAARQTIARQFGSEKSDDPPPISMKQLAKFHFPLTATTMVMFMGGPMISSALAQSPDRELAMAAWQVSLSLVWMTRSAVYALPEVVITLGRKIEDRPHLRAFCIRTGVISSLVLLTSWLLGVDRFIFIHVFKTPEVNARLASLAFILAVALPIIAALQSYIRGMLTLHHQTSARLYAIFCGIGTLLGTLNLGLALRWDGLVTASAAMTLAQLVELFVLAGFWKLKGGPPQKDEPIEAVPITESLSPG